MGFQGGSQVLLTWSILRCSFNGVACLSREIDHEGIEEQAGNGLSRLLSFCSP